MCNKILSIIAVFKIEFVVEPFSPCNLLRGETVFCYAQTHHNFTMDGSRVIEKR